MIARMSALLLVAGISGFVQAQAAEPVAVHLGGRTAADDELQTGILKTIALYGAAFGCAAPSQVKVAPLNASAISPNASFYSPALGSAYEEWDATFCGKTHRFLVTFAPDPKGGSFLSVAYPYPGDAPSPTFR